MEIKGEVAEGTDVKPDTKEKIHPAVTAAGMAAGGAIGGIAIGAHATENPVKLLTAEAQAAKDAGIRRAVEVAKGADPETVATIIEAYNDGVTEAVAARQDQWKQYAQEHSTVGHDAGLGALAALGATGACMAISNILRRGKAESHTEQAAAQPDAPQTGRG